MAPLGVRRLEERSDVSKESRLGKIFAAIVTTTVGLALLSCSATQPTADHSSTNSTVFEPLAPIARAPLPAPVGYASPLPRHNSSDAASYEAAAQGAGFRHGKIPHVGL